MQALNIAFDTIIVGALALPWLFLIVHLFFSKQEGGAIHLLLLVNKEISVISPAVPGVLLFAMAFLLGSAVSRNAQDFFNDNELVGVSLTEDNIRTSVYCDEREKPFIEIRGTFSPDDSGADHPRITPKSFRAHCDSDKDSAKTRSRRQRICQRLFGHFCNKHSAETGSQTQQIFHLQESALLLDGEDKTARLRQLHEQIMVLRGAAFNGIVACALCLFGWCAKHRAKVRLVLAAVPILLFLGGLDTLYKHFQHKEISDPPFMEFTLIVLGAAGCYALRKGTQGRWYGIGSLLSLLLAAMAYFGWWWTEVQYDQQVIYSFYVHSHTLLRQVIP